MTRKLQTSAKQNNQAEIDGQRCRGLGQGKRDAGRGKDTCKGSGSGLCSGGLLKNYLSHWAGGGRTSFLSKEGKGGTGKWEVAEAADWLHRERGLGGVQKMTEEGDGPGPGRGIFGV